ncbi:Protein NETWORKED 3A [Vitis vinifera]|uniref:Protein NETWORKED 3A n=1 Tax=Vitis vinifera TaxID=29760 RepID=A0A438F4S9_VITVI|nr:Protein NETWORKED 3A [Vitis vinifera]
MKELDEKTKAMLKIIEEDADSFGRRAEMYYKKRPELINMVEDFYRAHRSLAERYDQVRSDPGARLGPTLSSPFLPNKYQQPEKPTSPIDQSCDKPTTIMESGESEVDDPEQEDDTQLDEELGEEEEVSSGISNVEVMKLREEIERLKEENKIQKDQLMQKDEEKREVIRQLSLAVQVLKEENVSLRKSATKASPKKWSPIELNKLKASFLGKLFIGPRPSVVAL